MTIEVISGNFLNEWHGVHWNTPEGFKTATPEEIEALRASNPDLIVKDNRVSNWAERLPKLVGNLLNSDLSFACLQEINPLAYRELEESLLARNIKLSPLSLCRAAPEEKEVQKTGVTIAFSDKCELLKSEVFQSPAGVDWPRGVVSCDFLHKTTGKVIRVAGVHLKGYDPTIYNPETQKDKWEAKQKGKTAGYEELKGVIQKLQADAEHVDMTVIAGDFNDSRSAEYDEPHSRHKLLEEAGYQTVSHGPTEHRSGREIDYIYVKPRADLSVNLEPSSLNQDPSATDHDLIRTLIKV